MTTIESILDKAKEETGSDGKTGLAVGVSRQVISHWRSGLYKPNIYAISKLADITGIDIRIIAAALEYEKAEGEEKEYWANFYERVTGLPFMKSENGSICILC